MKKALITGITGQDGPDKTGLIWRNYCWTKDMKYTG